MYCDATHTHTLLDQVLGAVHLLLNLGFQLGPESARLTDLVSQEVHGHSRALIHLLEVDHGV